MEMISRMIKTEKDYEKALHRIEGIMDAEPGSPEMDELELLTAIVEMYSRTGITQLALLTLSKQLSTAWTNDGVLRKIRDRFPDAEMAKRCWIPKVKES